MARLARRIPEKPAFIERILVGDDLDRDDKASPCAPLKLAMALAPALGATIRLVHAYDFPELTVPVKSLQLIEGPYIDAVSVALEREAETVRPGHRRLSVIPAVEKGHPVDALLNDVRNHGEQLVVIGTHGRQGMGRAFLGSVAEELIRRANVPVLTINPRTAIAENYSPRKIMAALDFSGPQNHILEQTMSFARVYGSTVILFSVIEEWVYPVVQSASLLAGGYVMPLERDLKELGNLRDEQLRKAAEPFKQAGIDVQTRLVERAPSVASAIIEHASKSHIDLIISGHRHASRLGYALLGSVSRQVVREAHCPVLNVPPRK